MESDRQNNISGSVTTGQGSSASSGIENTIMVPDSPVHIARLPHTHHSRGGDNDQPDSFPNVISYGITQEEILRPTTF